MTAVVRLWRKIVIIREHVILYSLKKKKKKNEQTQEKKNEKNINEKK